MDAEDTVRQFPALPHTRSHAAAFPAAEFSLCVFRSTHGPSVGPLGSRSYLRLQV